MKRKFISALLFGALCITPSSVFVSCDDYDSDIENLQQQITANAQTLEQLSGEKLKNVAAEIEALKSAQKGLEDAYKNADEANKQAVIAAAQALVDKAKADLEAALDAANKRIDEQGKTVSTLLQNDAEMQIAITTAKEKADQAYGLAEQAKSLSDKNAEELTKVAEELKTIKQTLESQINALGDEVSALAEKVGKLESALTAQEASLKAYVDAKNKEQDDKLNSLKDELNGKYDGLEDKYEDLNGKYDDLNGKYNQLNGKYDDLFGDLGELAKELEKFNGNLEDYKASQDQKIAALETSIANLRTEIANNRTALESLVQAEVQKLSDRIGAVESALNTKIEDLKTAYNDLDTKDKELQAQIDEIEKNLGKAQETLNKEITEKIKTVNGLVDVLFADLKSLITGVIVQDAESEFEAVYAQVTNYGTNPGDGKTYFDVQPDAQNKLKVYFPYKGAKGAETLLQKQYNVQEKAGFFFATINPNTVDFNGQQLTLLNSQDNQPNYYKVEKAATANKLITRAAAANGLYEMAVTNSFNKNANVMNAPETNSKVVYALAAADTTTRGANGEVLGRKVYSKYEIKLNATKANALANANFELVGKDAEKGDGSVFDYRFSEEAATQGDLKGTLQLKPFFDAHKAKGADKVYRKYLVCTGAKKPMGKTTPAESKAAADAMNANKGFQAVLGEGDANFNEVPVTISEKYNGWIFTYDFYIWNYNGSIYKNTYEVIYTRPMIETQTIAMTHTPQSGANQNVSESTPAFSSLLCMTSANEKFVKNAQSVHIGRATVNGATINGGEFTTVTFTNGKEDAELKTLEVSLNNNLANHTFAGNFTAADLKTLTLTYNPAKVTYDKVYTLPISFKNPQGNLVNTVNVQFTMKRPTLWDVMIQRITNAFEGNVTIAWAAYDKNAEGYAYYDLSGSYNNVNKDLDNVAGVETKILFKDLTVYHKNNKNEAYQPLKGDLGNYSVAPFEFYHTLYVPNAAVDADSKGSKEAYLYNLEAGVKYFNLPNLYGATEKFQLKWYSPIYHADLTTKALTIGYPGELEVLNKDITSDDPSKSGHQNILYLADRDVRIKSVVLKPIMNGNVFADANTGLFTKYQVSKDGTKLEFQTTEKAALTGPAKVNFHLVVTDVFDCVKTHTITVTVDPNEHHAQKK